ncbi:MAG TPA: DNA translocase FtsK 4TM domain-containing protein, partial [Acidobacteriota bacterium]|nr:DNA translocase FtsK 4TM domain-containing protein [Acidobacteriota bacterium]
MAENNIKREIRGIVFLALAFFLLISLVSYDRLDPSFNVSSDRLQTENYAGPVGAYVSDFLFLFFGLAAYLIPIALIAMAFVDFLKREIDAAYTKIIGIILLVISICGFLDLLIGRWTISSRLSDGTFKDFSMEAGGWIGMLLLQTLQTNTGFAGALLVLATLLLLSLLLLVQLSLGKMVELVFTRITDAVRSVRLGFRKKMETELKVRERKKVIQKHIERIEKQSELPMMKSKKPDTSKGAQQPAVVAPQHPTPKTEEEPLQLDFRDMSENYVLPPMTLLEAPVSESVVDKKELVEKSKLITGKLAEFAISGTIAEIHPGPIVTTYEFKPEAGIKYSKIVSMANDLSMALKAESLRIDRLAGQSTIGIEVPNSNREVIYLREII